MKSIFLPLHLGQFQVALICPSDNILNISLYKDMSIFFSAELIRHEKSFNTSVIRQCIYQIPAIFCDNKRQKGANKHW